MARQQCAVCDQCGKHAPMGDWPGSPPPKGWFVKISEPMDPTSPEIFCSVACVTEFEHRFKEGIISND